MPQQSGLAGTARADDGHLLAGVDAQRDTVQDRCIAVGDAAVLQVKYWRIHHAKAWLPPAASAIDQPDL